MSTQIEAPCDKSCGTCEDCTPYVHAIEMHIRGEQRRGGYSFEVGNGKATGYDNHAYRVNYAHFNLEHISRSVDVFAAILQGRGVNAYAVSFTNSIEWSDSHRRHYSFPCAALTITDEPKASCFAFETMLKILTSPPSTPHERIFGMMQGET